MSYIVYYIDVIRYNPIRDVTIVLKHVQHCSFAFPLLLSAFKASNHRLSSKCPMTCELL